MGHLRRLPSLRGRAEDVGTQSAGLPLPTFRKGLIVGPLRYGARGDAKESRHISISPAHRFTNLAFSDVHARQCSDLNGRTSSSLNDLLVKLAK